MNTATKLFERRLHRLDPAIQRYPFLMTEGHECPVDIADVDFVLNRVHKVPSPLKSIVLRNAFSLASPRERNLYILRITDKLSALLPEKLQRYFTLNDDEIRDLAERCAEKSVNIAMRTNRANQAKSSANPSETRANDKQSHMLDSAHNVTECSQTQAKGFPNVNVTGSESSAPLDNVTEMNSEQIRSPLRLDNKTGFNENALSEIYRNITNYIIQFNIVPLKLNENGVTLSGAIMRMCERKWWKRRLRKILRQAYEQAAIELSLVSKYKQIYASDFTVQKRQQQRLHNERMMSNISAINNIGQRFSLKELSDVSVSNPKIRKAELMVRMRGFEELSKENNHQGIFITITCPSKYHSVLSKSGQRNPKYEGHTPYEANKYLCTIWSRIRAEWDRQGVKPYGFRVAEPQHDGTPHWHILLFLESWQVQSVKQTIRHYALQEDGDEKGAKENRCDFKLIDPKKGSATGYIAKYVSKNIDGEGLDVGIYDENPITAAQRVDAWASCWCIRQFQQIGGAAVSVWRELRRLKKVSGLDDTVERARVAADSSKWHDFTNAMGGVFAKRKERPLRLAYELAADYGTGECKIGAYDDNYIQTIKGLCYRGKVIVTRFFSWTIEAKRSSCSTLEFCK